MENCEVVNDVPSYSMAIPSEISASNGRTLTEENKICPICQSQVKLFFINFNEKFLMCESEECEYPFGFSDLEFFKEIEEVASDEEVTSIKSKFSQLSPSVTCSLTSTSAWNDIDKLNKACDSEAGQSETSSVTSGTSIKQRYRHIDEINTQKTNQAEIKKNLAEIKELNLELKDVSNDNIKNQKWIKNLKTFQEMSGFPLLKPEEISMLKADEPVIGNGELKIDIDTNDANNVSFIKIHITDKGTLSETNELNNVNNTEKSKINEKK